VLSLCNHTGLLVLQPMAGFARAIGVLTWLDASFVYVGITPTALSSLGLRLTVGADLTG
jgi:hypothetical protein